MAAFAMQGLEQRMEAKLPTNSTPKTSTGASLDGLPREKLLELLRDVTAQRDRVLSQFEAMAFQADESARDIAEAKLYERYEAERAADIERQAEQETAHVEEVLRQLEEERQKCAIIAAQFADLRDEVARESVNHPWRALRQAILQIISNWVAWAKARFPPDSRLLPLFDRAVEGVKLTGVFVLRILGAFLKWAKPQLINFWRLLKSEVARHMRKGAGE